MTIPTTTCTTTTCTTTTSSKASLRDLHDQLDAALQLPPEDSRALTNHLPMALQALYSLGASPQRMEDFFTHYARRFQGMQLPAPTTPASDWRRVRGEVKAYPALLAHFQQWLARDSRDTVLREVVPDLLSGVAAAAFHGAIRTAHAVESAHSRELAAALAYWACRWQPLALPASGPAPMPFGIWTERLVAGAKDWSSDGTLISTRMDSATRSPLYQELAGSLQPATDLATQLAALAGLAVKGYVASRNFTVLHMVTGLRAVRVLQPWVDDSPELRATLVHACVATYVAAGVKPTRLAHEPLTWPQVIVTATASSDDHVIKLVHACREEARHCGDGLYLQAATLALG